MNDSIHFRSQARDALSRARTEMIADDPARLRYAALELRLAMEALTYDRALAVKSEIPPDEYATWQPRKLMQVLRDIDPSLGLTSTLRIGVEEEYGIRAPESNMRTMGTDVVFTLDDLKEHYDAIGQRTAHAISEAIAIWKGTIS